MNEIVKQDLDSIIEQVGLPIKDFEGKNILISGGCGFLGSWFVALFDYLNKNHFKKACTVYAIDSFIAADKENMLVKINDSHIKFIKGDIADENVVQSFSEIDYIIHAAGIASPIHYRNYPIETIEGMVLGLRNLLNYAKDHDVKSFLYFSSSEIYGNPYPDKVPTREDYYGNVSCIGPRACYDESKRLGETYCSVYHRLYNLPVKWVRPFNISGPGMRKNDDRVLPKFIFAGLKNETITIHLPGLQTRTLTYITDAMVGFLKAMLIGKNGEVYNIGRDKEEISIIDLAKKVQASFEGKLKIQQIECPTEYPQDQAQRRCPDITKARKELGYDPKVNLDTMILRTMGWAKTKRG